MTDKEYIAMMIAITNELERIAESNPFKKMTWDAYVDEMHMVTADWHYSRRRRPWFAIFIVCFLLVILAWVILSISC